MNQLIKTVMFNVVLALVAYPLTAIAAQGTQPMATPVDWYLTGYTLEQHSNAPPVITAHFDHCADSPLAREKRMAKGILIGRNRVLAPADYFIDPCSAPIVLPESPPQRTYYCHDQRIKKITHLSLIIPSQAKESDETLQRVTVATPKIIKVLNELHFNGTSTIDALLCHKIENGTINRTPTVAVLSLSKRGVDAIPAGIETAQLPDKKLYSNSGDTTNEPSATYSSLLLRNHMHFLISGTASESDEVNELIEAARQLQLVEESQGNTRFDAQPAALITSTGGKHYLNALVNDWAIIKEFPSLYDLPDYAQRHPYISKLWIGTSPITGTVGHTLGMGSVPGLHGATAGILATVEIASTAMLFYVIASYLSSSPYVYTVMKAGLGFILASGFYRWVTSEY
ncbi:hypothetical protein [Endozoicomonas sp. ONNA2]|uniref:hypothetical protein n=1 Tax=Endozoicomonas sp. ONNA2 TaxID=2828741 RepID=UPI0021493792|nr:hypothetical protein [Endozoicomonas sp. ONNA2]